MPPFLCCPSCKTEIKRDGCQTSQALGCVSCSKQYFVDENGYLDFLGAGGITTMKERYVEIQRVYCKRRYAYIKKEIVDPLSAETILDVGCGLGMEIQCLIDDGKDAYGIDMDNYSAHWKANGAPPGNFSRADALSLPFPDATFDLVMSLGVIEHVGTVDGHMQLADDFFEKRKGYAEAILKATKKGGHIMIACPSKHFPIDLQHGPTAPVSKKLHKMTGLNIHPTFGKYHLLSYGEIRNLFIRHGGAESMAALPLRNYFGFASIEGKNPGLKTLFELYLNSLPAFLRTSFLNPYMLALIKK